LVPPPPVFKRGENGAGTSPIFLGGGRGEILAAIVAAWPDLPEAIRAGIGAMVKAALPKR